MKRVDIRAYNERARIYRALSMGDYEVYDGYVGIGRDLRVIAHISAQGVESMVSEISNQVMSSMLTALYVYTA